MAKSNNLFNENSHLSDEGIALYVDAMMLEKNYKLPGALILHVANCAQCKREVIETYMLVESQEYHSKEEHPFFLEAVINREKKFLLWYRVAAAIVVVISVGVIAYLVLSVNQKRESIGKGQIEQSVITNDERPEKVAADSTQKPSPLLAEDFHTSPNLENLVNAQQRSQTIRVLSPRIGAIVDRRVKFEWEGDGGEAVKIEIISNKDRILYAVSVSSSPYLFERQLSPGLYYWKLEGKNDLLYVGKFIVKKGS